MANKATGAAHENIVAAVAEINAAMPIGKIRDVIERTDFSADTKALLLDLAGITLQIGNQIVFVGRKIVSFAFEIIKRFPNTIFGVVIALTISLLIGSIPLLGPLLSSLLTPLLLAFGLTLGSLADFREAGVRSRISELEQKFALVSQGV